MFKYCQNIQNGIQNFHIWLIAENTGKFSFKLSSKNVWYWKYFGELFPSPLVDYSPTDWLIIIPFLRKLFSYSKSINLPFHALITEKLKYWKRANFHPKAFHEKLPKLKILLRPIIFIFPSQIPIEISSQ